MLAPLGRSEDAVSFKPSSRSALNSGEIPFFTKSISTRTRGSSPEVSWGGRSIRSAKRRAIAWTMSAGVRPNDISRGTSNGSLKRTGELHLRVRLAKTAIAVAASVYLKKLCRSWVRLGERITRFRPKRDSFESVSGSGVKGSDLNPFLALPTQPELDASFRFMTSANRP